MSATGIGASVKRKEDIRFITGKGHYVDDINRPGQAHAYFLRSPHAHATINKIDARRGARPSPGVVAIFTGDDIAADKVGGLICGWMIHSKDGSPMKAGAHPALAQGKVRYVGDHVAVVIADTYAQARDAAEKIVVDYGVLPAVDRHRRRRPSPASRTVHDVAPDNTVYNWHLGDKAATDAAFAAAAHVTKLDLVNNRLIPNADGAARGGRRLRLGHGHADALHDEPEPARRAARALGLHRPRARAQAARDRAGRRRRLRLQDLHLRRRDRLRLGGQEDRPSGQVDRRPHRGLPRPTRTAATTSPTPNWRSTPTARSPGLRVHTIANLGAYLSTFASSRADLSLRAAAVGPVRHPGHLRRGRRGLHQHRAGRRLSRRRPSGGDLRGRAPRRNRGARDWAAIPPSSAAQNFITPFPHQTPVIMAYDAGNYAAALDKALALADYKGFAGAQGGLAPPRASCAASASPPTSRPAASRRRRRSARSAPASACGNRRKCASIRSARSRSSPARTATARATRRPSRSSSPTRLGIPIENVSIVHGDTDKVQIGMGTYGSRSGAVGMSAIFKALDKIEAKAKKVAGHVLEASEDDIEFKDGKFTVKGTDKSIDFGCGRAAAPISRTSSTGRSSSPA